mgnify:CR=1 FL=1
MVKGVRPEIISPEKGDLKIRLVLTYKLPELSEASVEELTKDPVAWLDSTLFGMWRDCEWTIERA